MSDRAKKISELNDAVDAKGTDLLLIDKFDASTNSYSTSKIRVSGFFGNLQSNVSLSDASVASVNNLVIRKSTTPANATIEVAKGTMWFDENYLYVAINNNVVKRVELGSF